MPRVARRPSTSSTAVNPAKRHAAVHGPSGLQPTFTPEHQHRILCGLHARKAGRVRLRKGHGAPKQPGHVKRPPNSFMVFRSEVCDCQEDTGGPQQDLSRLAAALWRTLAKDHPIRVLCEEIAAEAARKHRAENPDYKYSPRKLTARPVAAPKSKPKARGRKKAAAADDEDDYVDVDEQHAAAFRPTLRARSSRRIVVEADEEDDEDEFEEEEGMVVQSDVGSVSSVTVVGTDSDSDRETTVTAPPSPSSSSASTPATAVLPDDSDEIVESKTEHSFAAGAGTPAFLFSLEGSSTPRPNLQVKDEPTEPPLSPLRPGCSPGTSLLASECLADPSYWPQQPDSSASDVDLSTVKLEDDFGAFSFLSHADSASAYESELASAGASGPWDLTRDLEDLKLLRFASDESSDTQMEIAPDNLSGACISMDMDVDMERYLAWGLS